MSRIKRITKELEDVKRDPLSGVTLSLVSESDLSQLKGTFIGPPGTPYENGLFKVDIKIPQEYPFKPPIMKFDNKIYHPNISSQTGAICLDILKDAWTPILTLKSSLISLQSLLQSPEPDDPQDAQVAGVFKNDYEGFKKTAQKWTQQYAPNESSGSGENDRKKQKLNELELLGIEKQSVDNLESMGFNRDHVVEVFKKLNLKQLPQDEDTQQKVMDMLLN